MNQNTNDSEYGLATGLVRDRVYDRIKNEILACSREPGSRFSESDLVRELGVSRGPVREALVRLAHEDLVVTYPQRGSFVSAIDMEKVEEAKFVRMHIESALVSELKPGPAHIQELRNLVALQTIAQTQNDLSVFFDLDTRFHRTLFEIGKKIRVWELVQGFCVHLNRFRLLRLRAIEAWQEISGQHGALVDALSAGDSAAAAQCMKDHIGQFEYDKAAVLARFPGYFRGV